jgi:rhodanese-related sulfurtransferase
VSVRHFFSRPRAVSTPEARELLADGAIMVDVRGEREYRRHHVPGAINIPLRDLEARAVELPDDRVVIAFCTGGLLSSGAANLLTELGFDAVNLAHGLIDWRGNGGPLVTDTGTDD